MTRGNSSKLVEANPKIERTALQRLRDRLQETIEKIEREREIMMEQNNEAVGEQPTSEVEQENQMGPPRIMFDYARPNMVVTKISIVRPAVAVNNFEIKPNVIQMV